MIKEFQKEYRWLSNFTPVNIDLHGLKYPSVEHAYMSAKSDDPKWKEFCQNKHKSAGQVKRASRSVQLVGDWDNKKVDIMRICIDQKFSKEPYLSLLIGTGNMHIQEGNYWNDRFWGICLKTNQGKNTLGKLIMDKRAKNNYFLRK